MKINIVTKNLDLTEAIRSYVDQKMLSLVKLLKNDLDPVLTVELAKPHSSQLNGEDLFKAEANLVFLGEQVFVDVEASDLYASIDILKDKLMRELRQYKEKTTEKTRSGARLAKKILNNIKE